MRLLIFALACISLLAQPKPSPPSSSERKGNQTKSEANQTTPPSPKASATPPANQSGTIATEANNETGSDRKIADYTGALARYTLALVVVGCLQLLALTFQGIVFFRTLIENRRLIASAEANAKTARESLEVSQRAVVVVDSIQLKNDTPQAPGEPDIQKWTSCYIEVVFKNSGPTEAEDFRYTIRPLISGLNATAIKPTVSHPTLLQRGKTVLHLTPELGSVGFRKGEIASAFMGSENLEVKGFIRYKDIFQRGWYVFFSSILDRGSYQFPMTMQVWEDGK